MSEPKPRPIRYGIMCDGAIIEKWQSRCIDLLSRIPGVAPALLIVHDREKGPRVSKMEKMQARRLFYQVYSNLIFSELLQPPARKPIDMSARFSQVPEILCRVTTRGRFSQYFDEEDVRRIREYDLDFILRFAFNILRGDILRAARYGVWSFHHDDERRYRGSPPCFWEIYHEDKVNGVILQRLTERLDSGVVLARAQFRTIPHSYAKSLNEILLQSAWLPARVCQEIRTGKTEHLDAKPSTSSAPIFHPPTNSQMLRFVAGQSRHVAQRIRRRTFLHDEWTIGMVKQPIKAFLEPGFRPPVQWFSPPGKGRFMADPFGLQVGGTIHIVYEDFNYESSRGVIATFTADQPGQPSPPLPVIDIGVHASYPYLLTDGGSIYCVPETYVMKEITLFRAMDFPRRWEKVKTILKGVAALDNTLFRYGNRWWLMFTNQDEGPNSHLFAWHALRLEGPWEPHALNPLKMDVQSARPAGTPFMDAGILYRPSQDCTNAYGGRIALNRVKKLTATEFEEETVAVIEPFVDSPFPDGIHTLSAVGDFTLVDGKRERFIRRAFLRSRSASRKSRTAPATSLDSPAR